MEITLALFPLPRFTLFPRTHSKLHIFEPRYREMMDYVMENGEQMALGQLREGYEEQYYDTPAVYRIGTAVRVLWADRLEDGRWNIAVEGAQRIKIVEEIQEKPFRIIRAEPLIEDIPSHRQKEINAMMHRVAAKAEAIVEELPASPKVVNIVNTYQHPGVVADVIASALVMDHYDRQSILAEMNIERRLALVNIQLHQLVESLKEQGIQVDLPGADV